MPHDLIPVPPPRRDGDILDPDGFRLLQRLMMREAGITLECGKEYLAEARLAALAVRAGYPSLRSIVDALQTEDDGGPLHRDVVEALAIAETSFFRDMWPFDALRTQILPELMARQVAERRLQIWSAACSTGQEPYSVAMLIREHFPLLMTWGLRLMASDMSRGALARATQGRYSQIEVNRGLPAQLLVRYFERDGADWCVRPDLRQMVQFRELNLVRPWPPMSGVHLILMRNVLLYFDAATRSRVLEDAARALAPGGYLVLGGGETTLSVGPGFVPVQFGRTVVYRTPDANSNRRGLAA